MTTKTVGMFVIALLAGCADNPESLPDPSSLEPPRWEVGDFWNYVDSGNQFLNVTVVALERSGDYDTYKVLVESVQDDYRPLEYFSWHDVVSLGQVEWGAPDRSASQRERFDPPKNQLFPLVNRTYATSTSLEWREPYELEQRVFGWHLVETPAGWFTALEVETFDAEMGLSAARSWYEPGVGNSVRLGDYRLTAWRYEG